MLSVDDRGPLDCRVVRQFLDICRRQRVRIWHGHDYKSNALGLLLRRAWSMRLVSTAHGWVTETRRTPLYYAIDRRCLARYDAVLCVSRDLGRSFRARNHRGERALRDRAARRVLAHPGPDPHAE